MEKKNSNDIQNFFYIFIITVNNFLFFFFLWFHYSILRVLFPSVVELAEICFSQNEIHVGMQKKNAIEATEEEEQILESFESRLLLD